MTNFDPIKRRFGMDKAPQMAHDSQELEKEERRLRKQEPRTWSGDGDAELDNPHYEND